MNAKASQKKAPNNTATKKARKPVARRRDLLDLEERLVPGENVMVRAEISNGIYWKAGAVFIIALLFAFIAIPLGVILAVFGLALVTTAVLKKEILMLVVTNKRIFVRYGILQVDVVDLHFDKIESIELERMLPGYLMGYANVVIMGTGNRYIVIPYVANPVQIRRAFNEQTLTAESSVAAPSPATQPLPAAPSQAQKAPPESPGKPAAKSASEGPVKGAGFVMKD